MTDEEVEKIIKSNMMLTMDFVGIRQDFEAKLQRTWVGLTHYELQDFHTQWVLEGKFEKLIDAVEAKLKEKNT